MLTNQPLQLLLFRPFDNFSIAFPASYFWDFKHGSIFDEVVRYVFCIRPQEHPIFVAVFPALSRLWQMSRKLLILLCFVNYQSQMLWSFAKSPLEVFQQHRCLILRRQPRFHFLKFLRGVFCIRKQKNATVVAIFLLRSVHLHNFHRCAFQMRLKGFDESPSSLIVERFHRIKFEERVFVQRESQQTPVTSTTTLHRLVVVYSKEDQLFYRAVQEISCSCNFY
jgi:hypothetical protein